MGLVTDGWGQNLRVLDGRRRGGLVRVEWMAVGFGRLEFEGPRDEMHGSRRIFLESSGLLASTASSYLPRPCLVLKNFQDFSSHRILRHMHGVLNIHENKNYLHSLSINRKINFLNLVTL